MQLYDKNGFTDVFESNIIKSLIKKSSSVEWDREENGHHIYLLKKKTIECLVKELQQENTRQREMSLFKKKFTRTLKELHILISILEILNADSVTEESEVVVTFLIKEKQKLLEL